MSMGKILLLFMLVILLIGAYLLSADSDSPSTSTTVSSALGGNDNEGYRRAYEPGILNFPRDHGPHPDFRTEWWYATGNLADAQNRRFGYQLTLFRVALAPGEAESDSAWRTRQVYMGHFAITDPAGIGHQAFERFSRAALDLAGAQTQPFRVWLEDWSFQGSEDDIFPLRLQAQEQGVSLDLVLEAGKPLVLQGDRGLSQKSAEPGNASYYYSYTRLPSRGHLEINGQSFAVTGNSWLDREWSTSALGSKQSGWDWFALQLDDGQELMVYRLRQKDGRVDPHSSGVWVDADGHYQVLTAQDFELEALDHWTSPHSGDVYPMPWRLRLAREELDLEVTPLLMDQELRVSVRYWEGAVSVTGQQADSPVKGQGYLEMTRYQ